MANNWENEGKSQPMLGGFKIAENCDSLELAEKKI